MPAYLETVINFDFEDLTIVQSAGGRFTPGRALAVVGPHTHPGTNLRFEGKIDSFAIFLQPAALWSLFRVPISIVSETHFDAAEVLGVPCVDLWHTLAETPDFLARTRFAENFLRGYASLGHSETATTAAAAVMARQGGRITVHDLASMVHFSERQLERSFLQEMGISPKRFARVARFQNALDARVDTPGRPWTDIAISSGYHDQMHLVHDFQSLGGFSPTRTVEQLGDSRPSALAASHDSAP